MAPVYATKKANLKLRFAFLHSCFIENVKYLMLNGFFHAKITVFFIFIKSTVTDDILYVFTTFVYIFVCSSITYRILIAITTFFSFL